MGAPPKKYQPDVMEQEVLARWRKEGTFRAQMAAGRKRFEKDPKDRFVFLEGPPTANGLPHPGHVLTRTLKDAVNRYHAMLGKWVPRKAGWDCHGLPVEIEVQKEIGIEHVSEIEEYGIAAFNQKCRDSVFRYKKDWEAMSERVGFWLDYDDPYVTMDDDYIESVWWSLKQLWGTGLLRKAYKVVPYSPITGTSYSSHEVAQGYKEVTDTAVFVKFRLRDDPDGASILSWTTTPWTLPGNVALAVAADVEYVKVRVKAASDKAHADAGEHFWLAKPLVKKALRNEVEVVETALGRDLVGRAYEPLFPGAIDPHQDEAAPWPVDAEKAWTILAADFVTTEDGTGVVHTAVMYGEDDYRLGQAVGLPAQHTVGLDGRFTERVPAGLAGRYVKDPETEATIVGHLRDQGLLYRDEPYEHSYPHCWRTGTPLLYYAMESWYIEMSRLRDELLENNQGIHWVPEAIREGRMGDWLRNVKDWAFSRKRYWGTPLPVWTCTSCGAQEAIATRAELQERAGVAIQELHRPYVDVPIACPSCGGTAQREPYVIDVWYDSGAAQFAQWNATSYDDSRLAAQWPIDFIAEGLDQTRGWFYSLLAISTALGAARDQAKLPSGPEAGFGAQSRQGTGIPTDGPFVGPPYRNVVVNGLILAEDGQKMSKSKKNYTSPDTVFQNQGADATRWYLLSATAPWQDKRFFEEAVRETFGRFFSTLWNTFLFWDQYARLDGWSPDEDVEPSQVPLDQWLRSRLHATVADVRHHADQYHLHKATRAIEDFVVQDLSNWWVRRSRDRFWQENDSQDKRDAHATLHEALHVVCRLVAPWAPFMVEHIWQHVRQSDDPLSVHLALLPEPGTRQEGIEEAMTGVRALAEAGRALRSKVAIPTRHPLARAVLVGASPGPFAEVLRDELNVKTLDTADSAAPFRSHVARPDRSALGPAFKRLAPQIADAIEALDGDQVYEALQKGGTVGVHVEGAEHTLRPDHIQFEEQDRPGWASTQVGEALLLLHVERDEELLAEALVREVVRRIQDWRRELDLPIEEQVDVTLTAPPLHEGRIKHFLHILKAECRIRNLTFEATHEAGAKSWQIDDATIGCIVTPTATRRPDAIEAA